MTFSIELIKKLKPYVLGFSMLTPNHQHPGKLLSTLQGNSTSISPLFETFKETRQQAHFYSKHYLETLRKIVTELDKIEILIDFNFSNILDDRCRSLLHPHAAAYSKIQKIINRSSFMPVGKNHIFDPSYKFTCTIRSRLSSKAKNISWSSGITMKKYEKIVSLLNKALIICPKCDVQDITQTAFFIDSCKLILASLYNQQHDP